MAAGMDEGMANRFLSDESGSSAAEVALFLLLAALGMGGLAVLGGDDIVATPAHGVSEAAKNSSSRTYRNSIYADGYGSEDDKPDRR